MEQHIVKDVTCLLKKQQQYLQYATNHINLAIEKASLLTNSRRCHVSTTLDMSMSP